MQSFLEIFDEIIEEINLLKKDKTLIIVSHNKEIFNKCDHVFKIHNKKIEKVR